MSKWLAILVVVLGSAGASLAQKNVAANPFALARDDAPALNAFSGTPAPPVRAASLSTSPESLSALSPERASSTALAPRSPEPKPRLVYGSRDDYRWQLGFGLAFLRFRSSIFYATAIGINTSVTYFTNDWFGIEGAVTAAFAPEIYAAEHVKFLSYSAGPKIAWRERRWEPWVHVLVGGAHILPQTAGNSQNGFALQAGGGADFRWNPRLSFRLQGDWVRTSFFKQTQNSAQLTSGVVFHF